MSKVLIAGCGYLGTALATMLARKQQVWTLRRNATHVSDNVSSVAADLTQQSTLRDVPHDFDTVFYTAAADQRSAESYRQTYVTGFNNLMQHLGQHPRARRVFFVSSTAVYPQDDGAIVDEQSHAVAHTATAGILLQAEALTHALTGMQQGIVARFSGLYGPGRTRLVGQVERNQGLAELNGSAFTNRIHRDDGARALIHLAQQTHLEPLYLFSDCAPTTRRELCRFIANKLRVPEPTLSESPTGMGKRCCNHQLLASGFQFDYPTFKEGYTAIVEQYQASQKLS